MKFRCYLTLALLLGGSSAAGAANFDGKSSVICATLEAIHCVKAAGRTHACENGPAGALDVPQFVKLDFANKLVTATAETGVDKTSAIGGVSRGNGHLVVQGVDDGHGWSLVLEEETGQMSASALGDEEGLMIFGACTQL